MTRMTSFEMAENLVSGWVLEYDIHLEFKHEL